MIQAAFYTKQGNLVDHAIRWRTQSPFSHVELVAGGMCYTSSPRDGGVRAKALDLTDGWALVPIPTAHAANVLQFYNLTRGCAYDYVGVLAGQLLALNLQSKARYFCSEWCAAALGLSEPWRYSPALLHNVLYDQWRQAT